MENASSPSFTDFEEIRNYLNNYGKGNIDFTKDEESGVAFLKINNPEKKNAITGRMMVQFRDHIEKLERWEQGKAVVVHGNGTDFCSGGDLEFARGSPCEKSANYMSIWMIDVLNRLQQLPLVSVCLLEGIAIGGGAEIAIACDFIAVAETVRYGFVHARMGLVTAWGGTTRLVSKIGRKKAMDALLTARILTASECLNLGIADTVVSDSDAFACMRSWLSPKIEHHYSIVRAYKTSINNTLIHSHAECLPLERSIFVPFWGGKLNVEALRKNIKHNQN